MTHKLEMSNSVFIQFENIENRNNKRSNSRSQTLIQEEEEIYRDGMHIKSGNYIKIIIHLRPH